MGLREKVSEALSKVQSTMRKDRFNETGTLGGSRKVPAESHRPEDVDEDNDLYAKRHRSKIASQRENQSGKVHSEKHPGFKAVQGKIEREGYSQKIAGAILASSSRHASRAAHRSNPNLTRVKGH